jgi:4-methoxybenzoate monooxygenase (O-demethylating)
VAAVAAGTPVSDYDPFTVEAILDAHGHDGALRELAPAVYLERYDVWAVTRWAEVRAGLADAGTFTSTNRPFFDPDAIRPNILLTQDPPEHTRVRAVIGRPLAAKAMVKLRETFTREAELLVDRLLADGTVELDGHTDVAAAYVLKVFPDLLGLPEEGRQHLLRFGDAAFNAFGPRNEIYHRGMERAAEAIAWVDRSIKRDAVLPGGAAAEIYAAADTGEIEEWEAELLVRTFFSAGFDTTIFAIGSILRAFAEFPEQWRALREDPSLVKNAFEEILRFESPSRFGGRATTREVEIGGVRVPEGARLMLMFLAAGRDPRRWDDPDRFDVRRPVEGHVSLGHGIHACVGRALARVEGQCLLTALVPRVERIELAGEPKRAINFQAHGHESVPVRLVAA